MVHNIQYKNSQYISHIKRIITLVSQDFIHLMVPNMSKIVTLYFVKRYQAYHLSAYVELINT